MGNAGSHSRDFETLRRYFEDHDQGHVFRFWSVLDAAARARLLAQARAIELPALIAAYRRSLESAAPRARKLEPVPAERTAERGGDPAKIAEARGRGEALLRAGRLALLVVAGGQATRLGFQGPKGAFPIGPLTGRTLFELQAQKIRGLGRRFARPLPWYVMTSPATEAATRALFERHAYFGLPPEDVFLFRQGTVQSFDFEGRLLLERPDRIFENPDGHGGSLPALLASGALEDMEGRGVDTIFYYQVDNPLVRIADPVYLGFHDATGSEMSCKVVRKVDPMEKVGVLARVDGRVGVVEYTELDDEHRFARDESDELVYWAGNTATHALATGFARRVAADAERILPYHASAKKIPTLDDAGLPVQPAEPNGHKLERFVFDALPAACGVCVVEANRGEEYSPIKNTEGDDSPTTARRDLVAQYRRWLEAGGIELPPAGTPIEIDHSRVDGPAEARALAVRSAAEAGDAIRVGAGGAP